ncbi:hypothetical protein [Salidesulfovibrio onnuriiensis]|uniref:hypothetical protein n=1 Tax=Salidesulfovibrio onnuriiensis TaxID=2583823 RepID=UPI0011CBAAEA|nr:hypothetical protein [Salidesulfovibrio onnuriiensis]
MDQLCYWTIHPKPTACKACKALEGQEFTEKPERPHPNCKCDIRKHTRPINIMGTLEGYEAHTTETFHAGQVIEVEVKNIGGFVCGADIRVDGQIWDGTGHLKPGGSSIFSYSKFGEIPLPWTVYLLYKGGNNSTLQYTITG